jgi:hypothetical protein
MALTLLTFTHNEQDCPRYLRSEGYFCVVPDVSSAEAQGTSDVIDNPWSSCASRAGTPRAATTRIALADRAILPSLVRVSTHAAPAPVDIIEIARSAAHQAFLVSVLEAKFTDTPNAKAQLGDMPLVPAAIAGAAHTGIVTSATASSTFTELTRATTAAANSAIRPLAAAASCRLTKRTITDRARPE